MHVQKKLKTGEKKKLLLYFRGKREGSAVEEAEVKMDVVKEAVVEEACMEDIAAEETHTEETECKAFLIWKRKHRSKKHLLMILHLPECKIWYNM